METVAEAVHQRESKTGPHASRCRKSSSRSCLSLPQGDCCPGCGGHLRQFGEDVAEQLEYIPESFKVIRHVRPKFACSVAIEWWNTRAVSSH